jgi:hypothetical protein
MLTKTVREKENTLDGAISKREEETSLGDPTGTQTGILLK